MSIFKAPGLSKPANLSEAIKPICRARTSPVAHVIEVDDAESAIGVMRLDKQRADQRIGAPRLIRNGATVVIEAVAKTLRRSASGPSPKSGPPSSTKRVGSPPVCESMTRMEGMPAARWVFKAACPRALIMAVTAARRSPVSGNRGGRTRSEPRCMTCSASLMDCTRSCSAVQMQQRHEPTIDLARLIEIALAQCLVEAQRFDRKRIGQARDPALGAEGQGLEGDTSSPANSTKRSPNALMMSVKRREYGSGLLDGDDIRDIRELSERAHVDVHPVRRVVVQHDRQPAGRRHGSKVIFEFSGRGHVDHGRQHHESARTEALRIARKLGRRRGSEFRDAHDNRRLAAHLDRRPQDAALLFGGKRVALTHRAHQNQAVHTVIEQRLLHVLRGGQIHLHRGVELRGCGGKHAGPGARVGFGRELRPIGVACRIVDRSVRPWVSKTRSQ